MMKFGFCPISSLNMLKIPLESTLLYGDKDPYGNTDILTCGFVNGILSILYMMKLTAYVQFHQVQYASKIPFTNPRFCVE